LVRSDEYLSQCLDSNLLTCSVFTGEPTFLWLPFPGFLWPGLAFDGGLTNDQPCLSAHTVTVSCLNRDADVNAQRHRESVGAAPLFALHEMVRTPPFERVWAIAGGAEVLYQPR
jgi:hypothetical protein